MEWERALALVGNEPVFRSAVLLAGEVSPAQVHVQLSRWVRSGRLLQIRRGLYAVAPPWNKTTPHPFVVANMLQPGSYVSVQSALAFYDLIPEHVPVTTSVGPGRPGRTETPLGVFQFSHLGDRLLFGYEQLELLAGQRAFVAKPEKALLDLVYLTVGGDDPVYLRELRLQNLDRLDAGLLGELAARTGKPKLARAARALAEIVAEGDGEPL